MKEMNFDNGNKIAPENNEPNENTVVIGVNPKKNLNDQLVDNSNQMGSILDRVVNIEKLLSNIWNEANDKWEDEIKESKWKYAAVVMDRMFLYLSFVYFVATFFPLVFSMANFFKPQ